jgi:hypothetical protein
MRTAAYFVVGSWCLGALIVVCSYNSLLISYILGSSAAEPLVDSPLELARNSNVQLIVDKGRGAELILLVITRIEMNSCYLNERFVKFLLMANIPVCQNRTLQTTRR